MKYKNETEGFNFIKQDEIDIKAAKKDKSSKKFWYSKHLQELKNRIKNFHLEKQNKQCCYCRKNFHGEFSLVIDIEHILPSSKFPKFILNVDKNLSVACKRCNMLIKKDNTEFLTTTKSIYQIKKSPYKSKNYKIIHPNLDKYDDHIDYYCHITSSGKIIKYIIKSNSIKGEMTVEYFRLKELEIDEINKLQGLHSSLSVTKKSDRSNQTRIDKIIMRSYN